MGQLPMMKAEQATSHKAPRKTALVVVVVTMVLLALSYLAYTVYANHSTISSLKSELSEKEKIIDGKDNLIQNSREVIHNKDAVIESHTQTIQKTQQEIEQTQEEAEKAKQEADKAKKQVEEQAKAIKELQKKVSAKALADQKARAVTVAAQSRTVTPKNLVATGGFQSGWKATFYNLGVASTGKRPGDTGYGITASGRPVSSVTIAVDPRYIPLGTWVEIKMPDGSILKKRADDTGRLIKGKKIDIYMNASDRALYQAGKQSIQIRILGKGSPS